MRTTRFRTGFTAAATAVALSLMAPGAWAGVGAGQAPATRVTVSASSASSASSTSSTTTTESRGEAWMGVWLDDAVDGGVEIVAVVPGGPAARADLRPGDIILSANRREIPIQTALRDVMRGLKPGDALQLQLLRGGRSIEAMLKLVARAPEPPPPPAAAPAPPSSVLRVLPPSSPWVVVTGDGMLERIGLQLADVTPALRTFYGAPEDAGVLVTRAEAQKAAGKAGIRVGDILVRLGDRKLDSEGQAEASLDLWIRDPRQPLPAVLVRDRESRTVTLVARQDAGAEVAASEQRKREEAILARRLQGELERLEARIEEIRRELAALRKEP